VDLHVAPHTAICPAMIAEGASEDLMYRLAVYELNLPPLRGPR
jgi:DNA-binding NtrC family response regulator